MTRRLRRAAPLAVLAAAALIGCGTSGPPAPPVTPPQAAPASQAAPAAPGPSAGGTLTIPRIPAERQDEAFRAALDKQRLAVGATPVETSRYGRTICSQLDAGQPVDQLIGDVQAGTGFPPSQVGYVIGAAAACYCPQNLSKLPTG